MRSQWFIITVVGLLWLAPLVEAKRDAADEGEGPGPPGQLRKAEREPHDHDEDDDKAARGHDGGRGKHEAPPTPPEETQPPAPPTADPSTPAPTPEIDPSPDLPTSEPPAIVSSTAPTGGGGAPDVAKEPSRAATDLSDATRPASEVLDAGDGIVGERDPPLLPEFANLLQPGPVQPPAAAADSAPENHPLSVAPGGRGTAYSGILIGLTGLGALGAVAAGARLIGARPPQIARPPRPGSPPTLKWSVVVDAVAVATRPPSPARTGKPQPPAPPQFEELADRVAQNALDGEAQVLLGVELLARGERAAGLVHLERGIRLLPVAVLHLLKAPELDWLRHDEGVRRVLRRFHRDQQRRLWTGYA